MAKIQTKLLTNINHKSLTLKQINKLNGIVRKTRMHERNIKILPHVDASPLFSLSSAKMRNKIKLKSTTKYISDICYDVALNKILKIQH